MIDHQKILTLFFLFFFDLSISAQSIQETIDSLENRLAVVNDDTSKINLLNQIGFKYRLIEMEKAEKYVKEARVFAERIHFERGLATSYGHLGVIYNMRGEPDSALDFHLIADKMFTELGDLKSICRNYLNMGNVYADKGDYSESSSYYEQSAKIAEQINDTLLQASALLNVGINYYEQGVYQAAIDYELDALNLAEKKGDATLTGKCLGNLGNIFFEIAEYEKAIDYYKRTISIFQQLGDNYNLSKPLGNIGVIYWKKKQFKEALLYDSIALSVSEKLNDMRFKARVLENNGLVYFDQGKYDQALEYFEQGLKLSVETDDILGAGKRESNIANTYLQLKQFHAAKQYFQSALDKAIQLESIDDKKRNYEGLSDSYASLGDFKKAYEYHLLFKKASDTIYNESNAKEIVKKEAEYQYEKKLLEKRIEQDKVDATNAAKIKRQNDFIVGGGIVASLTILIILLFSRYRTLKDTHLKLNITQQLLRSQMDPHFTSNALSSIRYYMKNNTEKADEYLSLFVKLMRKVLDHSSKQKVTLSEELETLRAYLDLEQANLEFNYSIKVDPAINEETAVPPLLLQPLAENAIWRGLQNKQGEKLLDIKVQLKDNSIEYLVEDNGVGRSSAEKEKLESHTAQTSHGTRILRERLQILGKQFKKPASMSFFDLNPGTRVIVIFPL